MLLPEAKEFREAGIAYATRCSVSYETSELFEIDVALLGLNRQLIENTLESAITPSNVNMSEASTGFG